MLWQIPELCAKWGVPWSRIQMASSCTEINANLPKNFTFIRIMARKLRFSVFLSDCSLSLVFPNYILNWMLPLWMQYYLYCSCSLLPHQYIIMLLGVRPSIANRTTELNTSYWLQEILLSVGSDQYGGSRYRLKSFSRPKLRYAFTSRMSLYWHFPMLRVGCMLLSAMQHSCFSSERTELKGKNY